MPEYTLDLEGLGVVTVGDNDFVRKGGQASIYRWKNYAVKLFHDPKTMQHGDMVGKTRLLAEKFKHPHLVGPHGLALEKKRGNPVIGYYMPFVVDGVHYPMLSGNTWRTANNFGDKETNSLVELMMKAVKFFHGQDPTARLIDPNILNWQGLLVQKVWEPRLFDLDSVAVQKWGPQVISPAVRDFHSVDFTQLTDWFSVMTVLFQLYTNEHPYGGEHPDFADDDLEGRMKKNVSVFDKNVELNFGTRDFKCIPPKLLDCFIATFQHGHRTIPPSPFDKMVVAPPAAVVKRVVLTGPTNLKYSMLLMAAGDHAARLFPCGVVLRQSQMLYDLQSKRPLVKVTSLTCELVKVQGGWVLADIENGQPSFSFISEENRLAKPIQVTLHGSKVVRYENRLFLVTSGGLTELKFTNFGQPRLAPEQTWAAMPNATQWFDGVGIMDAIGAMFVIAPYGTENTCGKYRIKELDGYRPIAARAGDRLICIIAADSKGVYYRFNITPDKHHTSEGCSVTVEKTKSQELNICFKANGVVVEVVKDGEMKAFVPNGNTTIVNDKGITSSLMLAAWGNLTCYIEPNGDVRSVEQIQKP